MDLHVSRQTRDRYQIDPSLVSIGGDIVFPNFHAVQLLAERMNRRRNLTRFPAQAIRPGQINAVGLIHEILHYVFGIYRDRRAPDITEKALDWLDEKLGRAAVDATLRRFAAEFPPLAVHQQRASSEEYLAGETAGTPHRQAVLEEVLMLWLANKNPAFMPLLELFEDTQLDRQAPYQQGMASLHEFFATQPAFGPDDENLVDMLRSPAIAIPHSISGQLEYIYQRWDYLLQPYLHRLLTSLDLISEEEKVAIPGSGPSLVVDFIGQELEPERFSTDRDWMPNVVLLAKNVHVWLDQLSRQFDRPLTRLDHIPDQVLHILARRGFSGLWLIGLWERSPASRRIKQMCGNPEAVASAYSLFDYQIAADLGGEDAYQDLKRRAWQVGIRLASDMVPNHVGIDSKWVIEHPDWFVSLDHAPYPAYTFNGLDLSWDARVGIYLEDHYYSLSDAAVVFKRVDHWTGRVDYIYHGNDGTAMPWNDTAQLNYLNPEVREAVIQTILHVARRFPIIRFDAAMTLSKRHYQRLWFPEPGTGGAIPSRAAHGLSKGDFNARIPEEFWRQVVDRVAAEVPDTLLLAEAFWLMEGYFVRTLGMHRVYNSAFMNMLRDEQNANYRSVMKNTLEFDPQILKRYVNFMNNPDERTAVDQFGKGDKYFGICTLMATLPGLPMFGHGQVEGFAEKYGMEYRRAYWAEEPDRYLIERHEREIFPLLRQRYLFADVENFLLYDFFTADGDVNEDVFAYSNRAGNERVLVIYHNRLAEAQGWIRTSAAYAAKVEGDAGITDQESDRTLVQKSLAEGLALRVDDGVFTVFRDQRSGHEFIRSNRELADNGLFVELSGYQSHVFLDLRQVQDDEEQTLARLAAHLNGRGTPSIDETLRELALQPVHARFRDLVDAGMFRRIMGAQASSTAGKQDEEQRQSTLLLDEVEQKAIRLLLEIKRFAEGDDTPASRARAEALAQELRQKLEAIWLVVTGLEQDPAAWGTLLGWLFTHALGKLVDERAFEQTSHSWIDGWFFGRIVADTLRELGVNEDAAWQAIGIVKALVTHQRWYEAHGRETKPELHIAQAWLADEDVQRALSVHRHAGILWFNKEQFEGLLGWMSRVAVITISASRTLSATDVERKMADAHRIVGRLRWAEAESGYQVNRLLKILNNG